MKQKFVIKVSMNGTKSHSKALQIAVSLSGVESAALSGEDKSNIEVVGDGVDAVKLTTMLKKGFAKRTCLRNNMGFVELISVSPLTEKDEQKEKDKETEMQPLVWQSGYSMPLFCEIRDHNPFPCSIL